MYCISIAVRKHNKTADFIPNSSFTTKNVVITPKTPKKSGSNFATLNEIPNNIIHNLRRANIKGGLPQSLKRYFIGEVGSPCMKANWSS